MKIELPVYKTTLPVKNIVVEFTPLIVKQEKIIAAAKETGQASDGYNTLIKIIESKTDVDIKNLTETDLIHLMLELRKKSIGEKFKTSFSCPQTGQPVSLDVDCSKISIIGNSSAEKIVVDEYIIDIEIPSSFSDITSTIKSIETINEKIEFKNITDEQKVDIVDSLPIKTRDAIKKAMDSLFHYEHILVYESAGTKRKIKLSSAEDFFTLLFVM
tara:strand:+ start:107 stop:751 length:645 start_codon:yes stop_codon:yes gene_type:complete